MPWTPRQEKYMWANHPEIAKRVMNEPGYKTKPEPPQTKAAKATKLKPKKR